MSSEAASDWTSVCCSPRDREQGSAPRAEPQPRRSLDTAGYLTSSLVNRIVKLEEQVGDMRLQMQHAFSLMSSRDAQSTLLQSQQQPPTQYSEFCTPIGKSHFAPPSSDQTPLHRRSLVPPEADSHKAMPEGEALGIESIEMEEDLGMKSKNLKQVKDLVQDAVSNWNKQMDDTRSRMEQALSMLRVRIEQSLSRILDLKTSAITQSAALEARIVNLEASRGFPEPKMTIAEELPTQANDKAARVEDETAGGFEVKAQNYHLTKDPREPNSTAIDTVQSVDEPANADAGNVEVVRNSGHSADMSTKTSLAEASTNDRERFAKVKPEYVFAESIWDACLFVGEPEVGILGSVAVFLLFVLNVFLQLSFCIICHMSLNDNSFDDSTIDGLTDFRKITSHDYRYEDFFSGASLARRLCQKDKNQYYISHREIFATNQIEVLAIIDEYLGGSGDFFEFRGQLMCLLALLCWAFNIAREAKNTWHFHSAMGGLKIGRFSELSMFKHKIIIDSLSYKQFVVYLIIVLLRVGICVFMLYTGCMWLCFTTTIEDLLLNAVALEFVLAVDELIFAAAVPRQTRVFMAQLAPVSEKHWVFFKGVDKLSVTVLLLTPAIAMFFYFTFVVYLVDQMLAAKQALCDRDLDFVFGVDTTGFVWFQNTASWASASNLLQDAQMSSLSNRIEGRSLEIGMTLPFQWLTSARTMNNLNWDELVSSNSGCADILDNFGGGVANDFGVAHVNWFRRQLQNSSISGCADLRAMGLCSAYGKHGPQTRWLCSETCECNKPTSISPPYHANGGCPETCELSGIYAQSLNSMGCDDMSLADLQNSQFWREWAAYMKDGLIAIHLHDHANEIYNAMISQGCSFLASASERSKLCSGSTQTGLRPLAPVCPIICGCTTTWLRQCPKTCFSQYLTRNSSGP